ncbi:MAG: hypothetical protein GEV07_06185 [Streptosporangiales bacterium]|nr:hypothetical protein [Streptosporangiales bacterium]
MAPGNVRFAALGCLRAQRGDQALDLGPARQQALLGALLCQLNQPATPEALLAGVWGDDPPPTGVKVLPTYVYRLHRLLGPPDVSGVRIEGVRGGYVLHADDGTVDAVRFERLVRDGQQARRNGQPDRAHQLLRDALALWDGEPYCGLPGPLLEAQRRRLTEYWLTAMEERIELDLAAGDARATLPELRVLCADHPGRERFTGLLMTALYRCGRQAEALDVYARARQQVVEQLGVEPGLELRTVHEAVLRGADDTLGAPVVGRRPVGCTLPRGVDLLGRDEELAAVLGALRPAPAAAGARVCVVDGMPGVGKTALAVRAARLLADGYRTARCTATCGPARPRPPRWTSPTHSACCCAGSASPAGAGARAARWRSGVGGKRLLVVLDDVAGSQQVEALLPGSAGCGVLVTSRRRLTVSRPDVVVPLRPLPAGPARDLLAGLVGDARAADEPFTVDTLARACGGLPAALGYLAARLVHRPQWPLQEMARRLAGGGRVVLDELYADDGALAGAFAVSYAQLADADRATFRALGRLPAEVIDVRWAAVATGRPLTPVAASMERLLDANLVESTGTNRYRMHPLVHAHAAGVRD